MSVSLSNPVSIKDLVKAWGEQQGMVPPVGGEQVPNPTPQPSSAPSASTSSPRCTRCLTHSRCACCGLCHACGARSQKVKGIIRWVRPFHRLDILTILSLSCPEVERKVKEWVWTSSQRVFARPCPVRPRHGFVESRLVDSPEALLSLIEETRQADPQGEIMLTTWVPAKWNAIWTPSLATVGAGHDGATSGSSPTRRFPFVPPKWQRDFPPAIFSLAEGEVPYIELVGTPSETIATQVRSGPAVPTSARPDFIPTEVEVREVIEFSPSLSLVEWERMMEEASGREGVVVFHPSASVTDHASVHARSRRIPIVTIPVSVGDRLEPVGGRIPSPSPEAVLFGLAAGEVLPLSSYPNCVRMILYGLHHSAAFDGEDGKWIGLATAFMLRLGSMALRGEARHENNTRGSKPERGAVYTRHQTRSLSFHQASVCRLLNVFRYGQFSGESVICAQTGYGGIKWAACAAALLPLFNSVRELARELSEEKASQLLRNLNTAVHQAHNGGWWLNKFGDSSDFDLAAMNNTSFQLTLVPTLRWMDEMITKRVAAGKINLDRKREKWSNWSHLSPTPARVTDMELTLLPGGIFASLKLRGRKQCGLIPISTPSLVKALKGVINLDSSDGKLSLVVESGKAGGEGEGSADASSSTPPSPPITLWTEPDLTRFALKESPKS